MNGDVSAVARRDPANGHLKIERKEKIMASKGKKDTVREAVAVFDDEDTLVAAADELMSAGFDRADLSLVAGEATVTEKLGHMYKQMEREEDDPKVPRTAFIQPESIGEGEGAVLGTLIYIPAVTVAGAIVATGGALAAVIGGAAVAGGAGALLGTVAASWIGRHHAEYLQEQLERGGLLLWVRTWNKDDEKRAVEILSRHSAHDVHVHTIEV